ncbi:hypothetical protein [Legionella resiliens]|uniref:Uncharacterized protein n=1 Tax=Legionella resiliens TaxID=2905958 RepID=A0ABS8X158_9GAMM|nr:MULTISPECIES: hypothetical protein [unclassified Legionella]MCE0723320.1 hypothetical protein [Legionella sp. 9fVS26]MCE3532473.1 hypothetical protein [Legionella sp. 8cVS16]
MPRPSKSLQKKDGKWIFDGYHFDEDDPANQMAYLFAGQEAQKRAKAIREAAERIQNPEERKQFIEQEIKKRAAEVDEGFQKGLIDIIKGLPTSGKDKSGKEAGKDLAISLMKGLGLNVNPDNVQTHYSSGPPQCFRITWVNRPTEELKDEKSEINQLSKCYANSLSPEAQQDFNAKWDTHRMHATNDGPKIDKTAFELDSAKSWGEFKSKVKQEYEQSETLNPDERDNLSTGL